MRFEIVIPDSTGAELQSRFLLLTKNLSASPELVNQIPVSKEEAIEAMFTPERLEHIDQALADVRAGNFLTSDQAKERLAEKARSWNQEKDR